MGEVGKDVLFADSDALREVPHSQLLFAKELKDPLADCQV
jgi:hypothetical protein